MKQMKLKGLFTVTGLTVGISVFSVSVFFHTVSRSDAQSQCVPSSPQDLGQVSVL